MADQNHQHEDNWSAAGMVGMFDAIHRERDRKRYRRGVLMWTLIVSTCLGIPLCITWGKFQDARRMTLLEEFSSHRQRAEELSQSNPAVAAALADADQLRESVNLAGTGESISILRRSLGRIADAADLDRDTQRIRQLLDPIGQTLLETPWHVTSKRIEHEQNRLSQQHKTIVEFLDQGKVAQAENAMAILLKEVSELQRDNVEAMKTSTARQTWVRLQTVVPERLHNNAAWKTISDVGFDADQGWEAGQDWENTRTLYARATERAQQFLESQLDPEEKAQLLQSNADALARLETEKADLKADVTRLEQQITKHNQQLAALISERQTAQAQVKTLTTERDRLKTDSRQQDTELATLRPLKKQLEETTTALKSAKQQVAKLTEAKQTAEESLAQTQSQLAARIAEVEALRTATASGDGNSPIIQVSATLAAIDSRLAADIKGKDVQAAAEIARERLADALVKYDETVALKQQALAEKYLPTSTKVKGIEATIAQAQATLANILNVLDEPLAAQYDHLQSVISSAESDYLALLKEVAPEHKDALKLKARIDSLKTQQVKLATPHARHFGKQSPSASELVSLCREQVQELLAERQKAEFARLRAEGKVPTAAEIEFVPITPDKFLMGSTDGDDDEQPIHEVTITKPFFAGKYEVTVGQILTWLNAPGVTVQDEWIDRSSAYCPIHQGPEDFVLNTSSQFGQSRQQPMVEISWHGAKAFCDWCSKQDTRFTYRLPTEAEWEYMARAGSTTEYPWGNSLNGREANVNGNYPHSTSTKGPYLEKTTEVGAYQPNAWGLYDTVGNVWEWCEDAYDKDFYGTSAARQPDPVNRSGSSRVVRSGSWAVSASVARSAYRNFFTPDDRDSNIGFRVFAE